jgi:hypothetical protein
MTHPPAASARGRITNAKSWMAAKSQMTVPIRKIEDETTVPEMV